MVYSTRTVYYSLDGKIWTESNASGIISDIYYANNILIIAFFNTGLRYCEIVTYKPNKTSDELLESYRNGDLLYYNYSYNNTIYSLPLTNIDTAKDPMFTVSGIVGSNVVTVYMNSDNSTTVEIVELKNETATPSADGLLTKEDKVKLDGIEAGAQVNKIETVDETQFNIDENKNLTLLDIAMSKVTGLNEALENKVDKVEGKGLSTNDLTDELLNKLNIADANVIEIVKVNGVVLDVAEDKSVDINVPIGNSEIAGTVKSSGEENKVAILEDATMEVNSININKLVQTEGDVLILNGGSSK